MSDNALQAKHLRLADLLRDMRSVAVAYSGGVDSALVLKAAIETLGRDNAVAVTGRSDSLAADELASAGDLTRQLGATHVIIDTNEFENPNYLSNPNNRCYFCKTTLYAAMAAFMRERGLAVMVNGVNADDLSDYRPGLQAADEHAVRSPLAEAGMTKAEVRELARQLGLPIHDKPASPCLSSRVPYGEPITPEKLRMIEAAEAFLRSLGVLQCRVRHHGTIARIEVPPAAIPQLAAPETASRIDAHLRAIGYQYVALDLRGFRSGSLNDPLMINLPGRRDFSKVTLS